MSGKLRVHELAKQLGVTSKELLAQLKEQGEFVKTASSTVEPPVVKRMKQLYASQDGQQAGGDAKPGAGKPGPKPAAGKPGPKAPATKPGQPAPKSPAQPGPA